MIKTNSPLTEEQTKKLEKLESYLKELGSLAVGFSGGVNSSFLLAVASIVLGDKVIAVTGADALSRSVKLKKQKNSVKQETSVILSVE